MLGWWLRVPESSAELMTVDTSKCLPGIRDTLKQDLHIEKHERARCFRKLFMASFSMVIWLDGTIVPQSLVSSHPIWGIEVWSAAILMGTIRIIDPITVDKKHHFSQVRHVKSPCLPVKICIIWIDYVPHVLLAELPLDT